MNTATSKLSVSSENYYCCIKKERLNYGQKFCFRLVQTVLTVVHGNLFSETGRNGHPADISSVQNSVNMTDPGRCISD